MVRYVRDYNAQFGTCPHVEKSIKKLEEEDGLAVVTGQQLTIFGGPLFTVYKIATAIRKAREIEETYNRPVVPVFWLADEDHDYEEEIGRASCREGRRRWRDRGGRRRVG